MKILVFLFFTTYFFSCKGQSQQNNCEISYEIATAKLNAYSKTSNNAYLDSAQNILDSALVCEKTRKKSILRKIDIFIMQEKYELGSRFVSTLKNQDFDFSYQRQMLINYMEGLHYVEIKDTNKKESIFKKSIYEIQNYIDSNANMTFLADSVAYYDLYFTKSRIYDSLKILMDLDFLKKKFPDETDAINRLRIITLQNIGN